MKWTFCWKKKLTKEEPDHIKNLKGVSQSYEELSWIFLVKQVLCVYSLVELVLQTLDQLFIYIIVICFISYPSYISQWIENCPMSLFFHFFRFSC